MFPTEFHKLQAQVADLAYKREFKKILSLINQPLENPGIAEHYVIANRVVNKFAYRKHHRRFFSDSKRLSRTRIYQELS